MAIPKREPVSTVPNGAALASFVAAGIGAFSWGVVVFLNEIGVFAAPALYAPAGGVTGRTTLGAATWLIAWAILHRRWRARTMDPGGVFVWAAILVALGLLLTFPPVWGIL